MTLKKAKRFHVFCLGLLMLIPLSSATAGFTGVVDYPARVQFPGVGHQTFHYAPAPYEWTNRRNWNHIQPAPGQMGFLPAPQAQYRGYQFRTMQGNYRNIPAFPPRATSSRFASYRWRPINPRQSGIYRDRVYQRPAWRAMPGFRTGPRYVSRPWASSPFWQPESHQGRGFQFRPMPYTESGTIANQVYRPTEITIPAHYVFRPITPTLRHRPVTNEIGYGVQNTGLDRSGVLRERYTSPEMGLGQRLSYQRAAAGFDKFSLQPKAPLKQVQSNDFQIPIHYRYAQMRYPRERINTSAYRHQIQRFPERRAVFRYPVQLYPSLPAGQIQKSIAQGFMPPPVTRYNAYSWLQPSLAHIRNGPNWYDGRADRDGAWYNIDQRDGWLLASRSEWRVPASLDL